MPGKSEWLGLQSIASLSSDSELGTTVNVRGVLPPGVDCVPLSAASVVDAVVDEDTPPYVGKWARRGK